MSKKYQKELTRMIEREGFSIVIMKNGGKHLKVEVRNNDNGETNILVASATPSDHRSMLNLRATLRRMKKGGFSK